MDNGRKFISRGMIEYFDKFNIQIRNSSVSRPQKSANKEILNGIKKKIDGAKGTWDEKLPGILWASRTTVKEATSYTPFSPVYGSEAVLLVEIEIPSTRITYYSHSENYKEKRANLDLLPETRGNALLRSIAQKQKMTCQFNRHVKTRLLKVGDLVLRKIILKQRARLQRKESKEPIGTAHSRSLISSNPVHLSWKTWRERS